VKQSGATNIDPAGSIQTSRRSFVKLAAAVLLTAGGRPCEALTQAPPARTSPLADLPTLDGQLLFDDAARQACAVDNGGHVHHSPIAVLKPHSVDDVVRLVAYANKRGLKIAMRGQGHSQYGQSQAAGGVVIDSSTLNSVRWHGSDTVDAQPGALWGEVAKVTLEKLLTPPVMPDAMMLTVGGTLSVGGIGETTYRYGAQVDNVLELDVITGAGELVTCSPDGNGELFNMTLAGVGQCGIIVRARLRLVAAPRFIAIHPLLYDDMESFLSDQAHLATVDALGPLNGRVTRESSGRWQFTLLAGRQVATTKEGSDRPTWMSGLRFKSASATETATYWDYLNRRTAGIVAARAKKFASASLVTTLPDSSVRPFLTHVFSTPEAFVGIWFFEVSPKVPARHRQPLQKTPSGPLAFELRMQRRAEGSDLEAMLAANVALLPRVQTAGGKIYPPYCPILSREQWQEHYGAETWRRFAAAKKRFDPNNVLTPGAGIF
jgi:FAD/FMN-containing dehydrogenase